MSVSGGVITCELTEDRSEADMPAGMLCKLELHHGKQCGECLSPSWAAWHHLPHALQSSRRTDHEERRYVLLRGMSLSFRMCASRNLYG